MALGEATMTCCDVDASSICAFFAVVEHDDLFHRSRAVSIVEVDFECLQTRDVSESRVSWTRLGLF